MTTPGPPPSVLAAILKAAPGQSYSSFTQQRRATFTTYPNPPGLPSLMTDVVFMPQNAFLDANVIISGTLDVLGGETQSGNTPDWVNVVDTGADPTGATDSTTGILAAFATLPAAGGVIYFPTGTYLLNSASAFTLATTGTVLLGDGPEATIIKIGASFSAAQIFNVTAGYCWIAGMAITGASPTITSNPAADAILLQGGRNCRVSDVFFQYVNGWCVNSIATSSNAGYATMLRALSGLNCAAGIHIKSNTNVTWGAQHFLTDINFQQIGTGSGANANLDVFRFEDCFDVLCENFNAAISDASTGSTINITGHCASLYFTNADLGAFPNATSMTNAVIQIQDGANGSPADIRFTQGEAQQGLNGLLISGGAATVHFNEFRFFNNYGSGAKLTGTGSEINFLNCGWSTNGQGGVANSGTYYDLEVTSTATGSNFNGRFTTAVVSVGSNGVQNAVALNTTGQAFYHLFCTYSGAGTPVTPFTHVPGLFTRADTVPPSWNGRMNVTSGQSSNSGFQARNTTSSPTVPFTQLIANAAADQTAGVAVNGDTQQRLLINSNGRMLWGSGSATQDTGLQRGAAGQLAVSTDSSGGTFVPVGLNTTGDLYLAASSALGSTMPRRSATSSTLALTTSGTVYLTAIYLPAGITTGHISMLSGTGTLKTGGTHGWYVLTDSGLVVRAATGDQTDASTVWGTASTVYTIATNAYVTTYSGLYYVGIMVANSGGTQPNMVGAAAPAAGVASIAPTLSGNCTGGTGTSQTTPPATDGSVTLVLSPSGSFQLLAWVT